MQARDKGGTYFGVGGGEGGFNRDVFLLCLQINGPMAQGRASKWQFTVVRFRLSLNVNTNDAFIKG